MVSITCKHCKKTVSYKKQPKHELCISCLRSINAKRQHQNLTLQEKEKLRKKISEATKAAIAKFPPEKKAEMRRKQRIGLKKVKDRIIAKRSETIKNMDPAKKEEWRKKISHSLKERYKKLGAWNLSTTLNTTKNKYIPENKWFQRGLHSSNEIIEVKCDDCGNIFKAKRGNLAKQEALHPGKIFCAKCKSKGERNPAYIDGRSKNKAGYTEKFFDINFRNCIIKKQEFTCPICGNELETNAYLHHIDYNRKNDEPTNLIFLHRSCHTKTNYNREFWQKAFFANWYKTYYEPLDIPDEFIYQYFEQFPLINHKISREYIIQRLQHRKNFNPDKPPSSKGQNISKLLSKKYFYSRKRKNNHSIVEILQSEKILHIFKNGMSLSQVVREITSKLYAYPVSLFSHHIMDWILRKWSSDGDIIYDPAGGFGGRLIGTYYHNIKYITTDPFTYDDLDYINDFLDLKAIIYNKKSEDLKITADLIVTCPPYFDDENYGHIENRNYEQWLEEYWAKTISNIDSRKFVLIIGEKYPEMIDIVSEKWHEKDRFVITNRSFKSVNHEFIIYFEK